jgi:hypothetical protein
MLDDMEIEISKPTPEAAELQALFNQTDKEAILCLTKEVEELSAKLEAWEKCADSLYPYACSYAIMNNHPQSQRDANQTIEEYKKLKERE